MERIKQTHALGVPAGMFKRLLWLNCGMMLGSLAFALNPTSMDDKAAAKPAKFVQFLTLGQVDSTGYVSVLTSDGRFAGVRFGQFSRVMRSGQPYPIDKIGIGREIQCTGSWDSWEWNCFNASVVAIGNRVSAAKFDQRLVTAGKSLGGSNAQAPGKTASVAKANPPAKQQPSAKDAKAPIDYKVIANNFMHLYADKGLAAVQQYFAKDMADQMGNVPPRIRTVKVLAVETDKKDPSVGHAMGTCEMISPSGWSVGRWEMSISSNGIQMRFH